MRTTVAYRRPTWRCASCGLSCACVALHRDCRNLRPLYGHHYALTDQPLDVDQLQQDGAQEYHARLAPRSYPGE